MELSWEQVCYSHLTTDSLYTMLALCTCTCMGAVHVNVFWLFGILFMWKEFQENIVIDL